MMMSVATSRDRTTRRAHGAVCRAAGRPAQGFHAAGDRLEDYLEFVAAVEDTAAELRFPCPSRAIPRRTIIACSTSR